MKNNLWDGLQTMASMVFVALAIAFLALAPPACASTHPTVQVEEVRDLVALVSARTTTYLNADVDLQAPDRAHGLGLVSQVQGLLVETTAETLPVESFQDPLLAVCALHDDYVIKDDTLQLTTRERYLRSTEILRRVVESAASPSGP